MGIFVDRASRRRKSSGDQLMSESIQNSRLQSLRRKWWASAERSKSIWLPWVTNWNWWPTPRAASMPAVSTSERVVCQGKSRFTGVAMKTETSAISSSRSKGAS